MHFKGKTLISRPTTASARAVWAASLVKVFVVFFEVNIKEFSIAGIPLGTADLNWPVNVLLAFLILAHWLNCAGDVLSFKNWNTTEMLSAKGESPTLDQKLISRLDSVLRIVEEAGKRAKTIGERDPFGSKETVEIIERCEKSLIDIRSSVGQLNGFAAFYLYIWTIGAPSVCALIALFSQLPPPT